MAGAGPEQSHRSVLGRLGAQPPPYPKCTAQARFSIAFGAALD